MSAVQLPWAADPISSVLRRFNGLLYLAIFALMAFFWPLIRAESAGTKLYVLLSTASYAALYLLPVVMLNSLAGRLLPVRSLGSPGQHWRMWLRYGLATAGGSLVLLAIYADYRLYLLYQYHVNGFVLNLLATPGGLAALGATAATERTAFLQAALFIAGTGAVIALLHSWKAIHTRPGRRITAFLVTMLLLLGGRELANAYSRYTGLEDYLEASDAIPFHLRSSATSVFKRLGIKHTAMQSLRVANGDADYPSSRLAATPRTPPANVIMLVAESFRWDLLTPEITPNLWQLGAQGMRFENHYSGGNRTRMGLFSMFYGIYAPYWYTFERQRVAPALMNFMREHEYQLAAHTSQSFNYPELRHTVFAGVPETQLREITTGEPWRRDIQNIDELIGKLDARDVRRPFFNFMFFESSHASYSFPEERPLRSNYLREMDYMRLDLENNIDGIHARYINAAHHIDQQVGRLLAALKARGLMDSTIVLFTGDHGEEFMEKGHWGHGHGTTFPEEQIRVPLVLWAPGQGHPAGEVIRHRTSHLQISPTLLQMLGVTAPARSYSSADPLFTPMSSFVLGEYAYMAVVDDKYKITFPFTGSDFFRYRVTDANDMPVDRDVSVTVLARYQPLLDQVARESSRFIKR